MGCSPSSPQDVDTLPIKAHCRTAFSRCSTTDRTNLNGQGSNKHLGQSQEAEGHDVVLCYPLGGTMFGLELQARYEKLDTVSLWTLDHFLSVPGTPLTATKSMSGGIRTGLVFDPALEIKPAPEAVGAATPNMAMLREVRICRKGVVVLVTAGCTWDDGVLNCLRLTGKFLRPLVMVHCVQSCPLPALEEWPPDIRPLIAASGPPVKYLTQHSTEALRDVEQRMLAASVAAAAADTSAAAAPAANSPPPRPPPPVAPPPNANCSCMDEPQPAVQQQAPLQPPAAQQPQQQVAPSVDAAAGAGPGPLSLAALQAADSAISRRAFQLLGPWTCGSARAGADGTWGAASRSGSQVTTTLVEALVASQGPSYSAVQGANASGKAPAGAGCDPAGAKSSKAAPAMQSQQPQPQSERKYVRGGANGGNSTDFGCKCVLRYRDTCWTTPVAFVCAQLENELGRLNVSVQVVASAAGAAGGEAPVAAGASGARLSLQSADSAGQRSQHRRQQAHANTAAEAIACTAAAAAAAAASLQSTQRSCSDSSSSRCSVGEDSGARPDVLSDSTSRRTSAGATTPSAARADASADELVAFATPPPDDCSPTPVATPTTGTRTAAAVGGRRASGAGSMLRPDARSMSWAQDAEPQAADPNVICVYFVTPGLSAPHGCLSEVVTILARGRRVMLVADGECCQCFPDLAPAGVTPEAWKAMRKLWHDRLLYVPDYHTSFCTLLRQGIAGTASPR